MILTWCTSCFVFFKPMPSKIKTLSLIHLTPFHFPDVQLEKLRNWQHFIFNNVDLLNKSNFIFCPSENHMSGLLRHFDMFWNPGLTISHTNTGAGLDLSSEALSATMSNELEFFFLSVLFGLGSVNINQFKNEEFEFWSFLCMETCPYTLNGCCGNLFIFRHKRLPRFPCFISPKIQTI